MVDPLPPAGTETWASAKVVLEHWKDLYDERRGIYDSAANRSIWGHRILSAVSAALSAIVGTTAITKTQQGGVLSGESTLLVAILSVVAAVLAALPPILQLGETAQKFRATQAKIDSVLRYIEQTLFIPPAAADLQKTVDDIRARIEAIGV